MPVEEGSWWDGMVASVFGIPCWDPNKQPNSRALPGAVTAAAEGNPESAEGNRECKPAFKITVLGPVPPSQRSSTPAPSFLLGAAARGSIADSTASQSSAGHDDEPEEPEEPEKPKPSLPWFNVKRPFYMENKVIEHSSTGLSTKQKRARAHALKQAAKAKDV